MSDVQDFSSADCQKLVPQGSIVSETRFIRTTLLRENLNEYLDSIPEGARVTARVAGGVYMAVPAWTIDTGDALRACRPAAFKREGFGTIYVGADASFLPGETPRPIVEKVRVAAAALRAGRVSVTVGGRTIELDPAEARDLARQGRVTIRRTDASPVEVVMSRRQPLSVDALPGTLAFSQPGTIYARVRLMLSEAGEKETIEAFLADPRSHPYHRPELPRVAIVTALDDDTFRAYFDVLLKLPGWSKYQKAQPPPAPQYPIAFITVFRQRHILKGYARGRLIESVTLGPEETVTTEIFSFDRILETVEETRTSESESSLERSRNSSVMTEIGSDVQSTVGATVGGELGLGLPIEMVTVEAGVSGEISNEIVTSNRMTAEQVSEAGVQAAERFTATHQVKTVSRNERGIESRVTRTFRNPNLGRTLNLHHFEIVGKYQVETTIDERPRLGLLVENPRIGPFDRDWVRAHHAFLDDVLVHDAYRSGLAAAQILAAAEWINELAAAEKRALEDERQRVAQQNPPDAANNFPNKGIFATARRLKKGVDEFLGLGSIEDTLETLARHVDPFDGISLSDLADAEDTLSRWIWWTQFNAAYPGTTESAQALSDAVQWAADNPSDPQVGDTVIAAVGDFVERFDDDWLVALKMFGSAYVMSVLTTFPPMANPLLYAYVMKLMFMPNDKGLPKTISAARADYAQHRAKQNAETLSPPAPEAEALQPSDVPRPPRAFSEKDLAQAHADLDRLILHLEAYEGFYTNAFYQREDPALRIERLNQMGVSTYVDNRILGFAGRSAVYPLKVSALPDKARTLLQSVVASIADATEDEPVLETEILVPTGGVQSEIVLGSCEALEPYLVERRALDLESRRLQNELLRKQVERLAADDPSGQPADSATPE